MPELLLVNPRRRRRKSKTSSRRRVRARAKSPRRHRRRAVAKISRRRRTVRLSNPRRRRYKRNPSFRGLAGGVVPTLKAGAIGAVGALGTDLAYGYASKWLPTSMQTGMAANAAKLVLAILVGAIGNKVLKGKGKDLAIGAVTVQLHDLAKAQLQAAMPSLPLGQYLPMGAYFGAGTSAMGYRNNVNTPILTTGLGRLGGLGNTNNLMTVSTESEYNDGIF